MRNIILLMVLNITMGQAQPKYFEKTLPPFSDVNDVIILAPHGNNYIAFGRYMPLSEAYSMPYSIIINEQGDVLNSEVYQDINIFASINEIVYTDNHFVCAGTSFGNGGLDKTFFRTIDDSCEATSLSYPTIDTLPTGGFAITPTQDGNYVIGGFTHLDIVTPQYIPLISYAVKVSPAGNIIWQHWYLTEFAFTLDNYIHAVLQDNSSSDLFYFGVTNGNALLNPTQADMYMARADSSGNILWTVEYDYGSRDILGQASWTPDNKIVFSGMSSTEAGAKRGCLGKVDTSGQIIWFNKYEVIHGVEKFIMVNNGQNYVLCGSRYYLNPVNLNAAIVKTDSVGQVLWARDYGGAEYDYAYCIAPTNDGGYLMMGRKDSSAISHALVYIIKTNCMGLLTEPQAEFDTQTEADYTVSFFNQSMYTYPDSIDGGHYRWDFGDGSPPFMCGQGYGPCPAVVQHTYAQAGTYTAQLTAIVCSDTAQVTQTVAAAAVGMPVAVGQEGGIKVYPNPASETLSLRYKGTQAAQWVLYDMSGRICKQLTLLPNTHTQTLPITDLSAGVYYYTLQGSAGLLGNGKVVVGY